MSNGKFDEDLGKLVRRYGYERICKRLKDFKPRPDRAEAARNSALPTAKKSSPKKKLGAVAVVSRINVVDGAKQKVLIEMAEKFDRGEFLPHVSEVRMLLDSLGKETDNIKSRTQVVARLFRMLAEEPVENLREINSHHAFTGRFPGLHPIANAIARAGRRDREQRLPEQSQETR